MTAKAKDLLGELQVVVSELEAQVAGVRGELLAAQTEADELRAERDALQGKASHWKGLAHQLRQAVDELGEGTRVRAKLEEIKARLKPGGEARPAPAELPLETEVAKEPATAPAAEATAGGELPDPEGAGPQIGIDASSAPLELPEPKDDGVFSRGLYARAIDRLGKALPLPPVRLTVQIEHLEHAGLSFYLVLDVKSGFTWGWGPVQSPDVRLKVKHAGLKSVLAGDFSLEDDAVTVAKGGVKLFGYLGTVDLEGVKKGVG